MPSKLQHYPFYMIFYPKYRIIPPGGAIQQIANLGNLITVVFDKNQYRKV